jgi:hypothetical protein
VFRAVEACRLAPVAFTFALTLLATGHGR